MSDLLLEIAKHEQLKGVAKNLGVPVPPVLSRSTGAYAPGALLEGETICVNVTHAKGSGVRKMLEELGAIVVRDGDEDEGSDGRLDGLCFDARGFSDTTDVDEMYAFFHRSLINLASSTYRLTRRLRTQ